MGENGKPLSINGSQSDVRSEFLPIVAIADREVADSSAVWVKGEHSKGNDLRVMWGWGWRTLEH